MLITTQLCGASIYPDDYFSKFPIDDFSVENMINISLNVNQINKLPDDTVKKVKTDTLNIDDEEEAIDTKIIYKAKDSIRYEHEGNRLLLFGDAVVEYESMSLKAEFIEIDNKKGTMTAFGKVDSTGKQSGNPVFKEAEQEIKCRKIVYNLKTRKGKIYDVITKEGDLLLLGSEVKKDSNDVVYMKDLRCIPCEHEDARTMFRASKAKIIPDDKIVTGPMYLEIGGVPTPLGLPFGYFPNTKKRHSGILMPFFNSSANLGFNLKDGGFYWGINDKTDMTIRGDIYTNGSWGLRTLNNYNVKYKFNGSLSLGYSEFILGEKEIPSTYSKQKDIAINWRHIQDQKSNPSIRFSSDVNIRTSKYNRFNAMNTGQYLQNTFQSNINFTKTFKSTSLSINARHNQNTQTKKVEISFPELTFNVNRFYPFKKEGRVKQNPIDKIGISYLFEARNILSGADSTLFKGNIGDSLKYGVRHSIPISTNITLFKYFTMTPALNLSSVMYTKTSEKNFDYTTNKIQNTTANGFKAGYDANFSTALTTKVFMDYIFKTNKLQQIRHLLIPTLNYTYRPDFGEEQFGFWKEIITDTTTKRTTRYSVFENTLFGGPSIGAQNSLGFNLNNTIDAKVKKTSDTGVVYNKVQILQNLGITGTYNFAADSNKLSNIGINGRTKIWKYFDLVFGSSFNPYVTNITTGSKTKEYLFNQNGKLAQFETGNIALNAAFSSGNIQSMRIRKPDLTNGAEMGANSAKTNEQSQEQLPWNLNVYYNITFRNQNNKLTNVQTLNFSGDIKVTQFWKLGVTSGYDFNAKNLSYTSMNLYRDLKCWEARIDWVPFGFRKSYSLTINLKTSMLSDVKIPRQRQWYDNL